MQLSAPDKKLEASWKEVGVLRELNPSTMPLSKQTVVFSCFDKRYVSTWFDQMVRMASKQQERAVPELFPVICAGSPLLVAPSSPIHERFDHRGMVEYNLKLAQQNGCHNVTIFGHFPCLAGEEHRISLFHNAALLVAGKRWLESRGAEATIIFDIKHEENAPCQPWHLKASEFEAWCQTYKSDFLEYYPEISRSP